MTWLGKVLNFLRPSREIAKSADTVDKADLFLKRDLKELRRFEFVVRRR